MPDRTQVLLELALQEDIGAADITSDAIFGDQELEKEAIIVARQQLIVAGIDVARKTFLAIDHHLQFEPLFAEGAVVQEGQPVIRLAGRIRSLLKGERLALNFLQHLSGIATYTRQFVDKVRKYPVLIFDTRKTTPGLRDLEKKAVRMGGARNHRMGLYDRVLIKDNHIAACGGSVGEAIRKARENLPSQTLIEVEVDRLEQIEAALKAQAEILLLDNFTPRAVKRAKKLIKDDAEIEISGGITLDNVVKYAKAGPNRISVGSLTHSAPAVDLALEIVF